MSKFTEFWKWLEHICLDNPSVVSHTGGLQRKLGGVVLGGRVMPEELMTVLNKSFGIKCDCQGRLLYVTSTPTTVRMIQFCYTVEMNLVYLCFPFIL